MKLKSCYNVTFNDNYKTHCKIQNAIFKRFELLNNKKYKGLITSFL